MPVIIMNLPDPAPDTFYEEPLVSVPDWFQLHPVAKSVEAVILSYDRFHLATSLTSRLQIEQKFALNQ